MKYALALMMIVVLLLTACQQATQPEEIADEPTSSNETIISTPWGDNCAPIELSHFPATGCAEMVSGDEVIVEIQYSDDNPLDIGVSSGINKDIVWFVIVPPRGEVLRFEYAEDFIELTSSSAKVILVDPIAGMWTVNAYAGDYASNLATWTWVFRVQSTGPIVNFGEFEDANYQYNSFWNPAAPLHFAATVEENDGANVRNGDISVHFVGLFDCDGTICERDLMVNVSLDVSPAYDNRNVNQIFIVTGEAMFGACAFKDLEIPNDIQIVLTAGDQYGTVTKLPLCLPTHK